MVFRPTVPHALPFVRPTTRKVALTDYDHALSLNPTYAEAFAARGLAKLALKLVSAAQEDFAQAIKLNPSLQNQLSQRIESLKSTVAVQR